MPPARPAFCPPPACPPPPTCLHPPPPPRGLVCRGLSPSGLRATHLDRQTALLPDMCLHTSTLCTLFTPFPPTTTTWDLGRNFGTTTFTRHSPHHDQYAACGRCRLARLVSATSPLGHGLPGRWTEGRRFCQTMLDTPAHCPHAAYCRRGPTAMTAAVPAWARPLPTIACLPPASAYRHSYPRPRRWVSLPSPPT